MNNIFTRFWNFVVNGKSIISKSCCPNISVGDELEGNPIIESSKYSTRIDFLKSKYKLIK